MENRFARARVERLEPLSPFVYPALLAGAALFTTLVALNDFTHILAALRAAGWGLVGVALFHIVPLWADAMGWRRLIGAMERPSTATMMWARWLGESVNQLLPVMQVGGNVVKAQTLARRGIDSADAGASVVVDVTLLFLTQVLFTILGLITLVALLGGGDLALTALIGSAVMALAAVGFYQAQQRGMFRSLVGALGRIARGHDLLALTGGAEALDASVTRCYRNRAALFASGAWHVVGWLAGTGEVWLALRLLGHPVGIAEALLIESLGQAVRAAGFMVPGALGVQEGGLLALGGLVGVAPETAIALALTKRARELLLGLPGLVSWQLSMLAPAATPGALGPASHRTTNGARLAPATVRTFNAFARPLARSARLDVDEMLDRVRRRTGLADFGEGQFYEPLRRLLASFDADADLTPIGRLAARHDVERLLTTRLRIEADRRRSPEIAAQHIRFPIFVTGLPRTGTTLLHGILSCDPAARAPLGWDTMYPSPPPNGGLTDRRILKAAFQLSWVERLAPGFEAIHPLGALVPQECLVITSHSFLSFQFQTSHRVTSYQAWLEAQDQRPAYDYHRRVLQHLQARRPTGRWVVKAPAHLFGLEAIFAVYPDAGIVFTHRDPLEVAASVASLTCTLRGAFAERIDPAATAREMTERWAEGMRRALDVRDSGRVSADRFVDVDYRDLMRDPIGAVRRIYAQFGLTLGEDAERRMRSYLVAHPKNVRGRHRYSLEAFGLDAETERRRYAFYRERFIV